MAPRQEILHQLRSNLARLRQVPPDPSREPSEAWISTIREELRQLLPAGGFERGTLVEWFSRDVGSGAGTLALEVAREAARTGGAILVLDRKRWFYPIAAVGMGIDLRQLIVGLTQNARDDIWAMDQALRCPGVAAVWTFLDKIDRRAFRRLQLAAEAGRSIGLLLRHASAVDEPSWAHLRLLVEPRGSAGPVRRVWIELLRNKGGVCRAGTGVELILEDSAGITSATSSEVQHEADSLSVVPPLADPTVPGRPAGTSGAAGGAVRP